MPKQTPLINNFNSGELSPLVESRSDLAKYASGCLKIENAIPLVEGGAKKMPGTYFVISTKYADKKARLAPFSFSTIQTYVLEFGNLYIRIFKNKGLVVDGSGNPIEVTTPYLEADLFDLDLDTQSADVLYIFHRLYAPMKLERTSDTAWTLTALACTGTSDIAKTPTIAKPISDISKANPAVVTAANHGFTGGEKVYISGVVGMVEVNQQVFTVANPTGVATEYDPAAAYAVNANVDVGQYVALEFSGGRILYVSAPSTDPITTLTLNVISNSTDALVVSSGTINLADTTPSNNSADLIQAALQPYHAGWVVTENAAYAANRPTSGIAIITADLSADKAGQFQCSQIIPSSATNTNHFPAAEALYWLLSGPVATSTFALLGVNSTSFNMYTAGGTVVAVVSLFGTSGDYPACGTFFEQRLMVAGSDNNPLRVRGSVQGDYENFISDVNADDYAIQYDILSGKQDRIRWMVGQEQLMLGSSGGVGRLTSGSSDASLSQKSVDYKKQISTGVGSVHPQIVNDSIIWTTRSAKTVRLLQYVWQSNQWVAPDLTRVAHHITKGATATLSGVLQTAFQSEPYPLLWSIRADGQLLGLTFESQEQVYAWSRIVTDGVIESVACISQDNDEDQVWIIVNRTINGATVRYVEYFKPQEIFSQIRDAFFVHSGLTWDGGASVDITHISQANPAVVTAPGHTFTNAMKVQITGVTGMVEANQAKDEAYIVAGVSGDTFQLSGIDSSAWTSYQSGGTAVRVTDTVTGLNHLEAKAVRALGDGAVIYDTDSPVVTSGSVTLPYYANLIHIGLPFSMKVLPMNPVIANQQGTSRGKKQKISRATFCFYETCGAQYGLDEDNLYDVPFGTGIAPVLFTGDITLDLAGEWGDQASIAVVSDNPFPFTLKAIAPDLSVSNA